MTNKRTNKPLSAKSKENVHGTLHKALEKAVSLGYIRHNPADKPNLPKVQKAEIKPLADDEMISLQMLLDGTSALRLSICISKSWLRLPAFPPPVFTI